MPKREIEDFISHWSKAELSENQISQPFLVELCDLLDVPQPDNRRNGSYTFEFHVSELQHDGTTKEGRIDLYKRGCFVFVHKTQKVTQEEWEKAQPKPYAPPEK
ncbi:MAG: type IIL restriction-modification enzyme MmeI [Planctomycetota bacterium]